MGWPNLTGENKFSSGLHQLTLKCAIEQVKLEYISLLKRL